MRQNGFTITEMVVIIAVFAIIFWLLVTGSTSFIGNQLLYAERDTLVSLLRDARSRAMGNINQSNHGIFIDTDKYISFDGASYAARDQAKDALFPKSSGVTTAGPNEIMFSALDGQSNASGTITVLTNTGSSTISINNEGQINW
ncbi:MAG TPA: prepilin-type N-terminal cleavage/methylation domain-containing protein [Candidatus Paceibacterota bacterium]